MDITNIGMWADFILAGFIGYLWIQIDQLKEQLKINTQFGKKV